jgi:CO/xanthine dehydrogenase FAD-binding subunit
MSINAHPELPEFEYIRPASLADASRFLFEHPGEARPLLGGTDIFVRMRDGFWRDRYLVDVKGLDGTHDLKFEAAGPHLQFVTIIPFWLKPAAGWLLTS